MGSQHTEDGFYLSDEAALDIAAKISERIGIDPLANIYKDTYKVNPVQLLANDIQAYANNGELSNSLLKTFNEVADSFYNPVKGTHGRSDAEAWLVDIAREATKSPFTVGVIQTQIDEKIRNLVDDLNDNSVVMLLKELEKTVQESALNDCDVDTKTPSPVQPDVAPPSKGRGGNAPT